MSPRAIQQIESGLVVALAQTVAFVLYPPWWWVPLATFLLFDLSMLGYLRSAGVGAGCYNAVHNFAWAGALAVVAVLTVTLSPTLSLWSGLAACAWAFHVGVDRMFGYGIKFRDAFTHTHLGWLGQARTSGDGGPGGRTGAS